MKWKLGVLSLIAIAVASWLTLHETQESFQRKIAQKIIIDIRYYCSEMQEHADSDDCKTPVTKLPKSLENVIQDTNIGGVILFAENLETPQQIIGLTRDLQLAAKKSPSGLPLFISVDQEGGSVARLPSDFSTRFSGNMAIGATFERHGDKFARLVGRSLGRELYALGINLNHAPSIDVNSNPDNPVINVRAFSDQPETVAKLGSAMLQGMQEQGVIGTIKHFPGHGDTIVDSHTGLPLVNHSRERIMSTDIEPFRQVMSDTDVHMIMTAHIQFPGLDNSTLTNKFGEKIIKPATLSKRILTGLLRDELGYEGLVITDALDMKGISQFFSADEAVFNTFKAGADIALMPVKIRKPADIKNLYALIESVSQHALEEDQAYQQVLRSYHRVVSAKEQLLLNNTRPPSITQAEHVLANPRHRSIENELATRSVVEWNKMGRLMYRDIQRAHVILPEHEDAQYLAEQLQYLGNWEVTSEELALENGEIALSTRRAIESADLLIVGNSNQLISSGVLNSEDLPSRKIRRADLAAQLLSIAGDQKKSRVYISLGSPYGINNFIPLSDTQLFAFNKISYQLGTKVYNPTLLALANVISGRKVAEGKLPVSHINKKVTTSPPSASVSLRAAHP